MKPRKRRKPKMYEDKKDWKSVGIPGDVHEKLKEIAEIEDRPINRQLARIINQVYEDSYACVEGIN
jgi:hypothetical protein